MNYLVAAELSSSQVAAGATIATIRQASRQIDAFVRRPHGLEVAVITEKVFLDMDMAGNLSTYPFRGWETEGDVEVFYFGSPSSIASLTLADISIDVLSGRFRANAGTPRIDPGWISPSSPTEARSPFADTLLPYYASGSGQITDNARPFFMNVSYRAGYFTEKTVDVDPSGMVDLGSVTVADVDDLVVGQEFYFSSDPTLELDTDTRFITGIDPDLMIVYFTPELTVDLVAPVTLRQIDKAVRAACLEVISDLTTFSLFPSNVKSFSKGLGKGDLTKSWTRFDAKSMSPLSFSAQNALVDYRLV